VHVVEDINMILKERQKAQLCLAGMQRCQHWSTGMGSILHFF
jgi:hypothetical protein